MSNHKIAVLDYRIPEEVQKEIRTLASNNVSFSDLRCPENDRIARTGDAEIVLITPWEKIDTNYLNACPNLKYIGLCGTSTANVDVDELSRRGIDFTNMQTGKVDKDAKSAGGKQAVAEFFFMQLVRLARGIGTYQWKSGKQLQLKNSSIGIVGLGEVGQGIARMALAYNMNVSYYGPNRKIDWEKQGVQFKDKPELLKESDIIVLCSPTNVQVIANDEFDYITDGSILVQACGGSPFDKPAFYKWIAKDGNFAIFDMSAGEQNYELYKNLPRVLFSKHVAGDTHESNLARAKRALYNLKEYLENSKIRNS